MRDSSIVAASSFPSIDRNCACILRWFFQDMSVEIPTGNDGRWIALLATSMPARSRWIHRIRSYCGCCGPAYVTERGTWPASRTDLLRFYCRSVYAEKAKGCRGPARLRKGEQALVSNRPRDHAAGSGDGHRRAFVLGDGGRLCGRGQGPARSRSPMRLPDGVRAGRRGMGPV